MNHLVFENAKEANLMRLKHDINWLLECEELMWKQRSRALWLFLGDKNTKFFHHKASQRKTRNYISKLQDDKGEWRAGEELEGVIVPSFFRYIFCC